MGCIVKLVDNTKDYSFFNLLTGIDKKHNDIIKPSSPAMLAFDDCENTVLLNSGDISKARGSVKVTSKANVSILSSFEYNRNGEKSLMVHTNEGKLYEIDITSYTWSLVQDSLSLTSPCVGVNYLTGIVVSDGINGLVYYDREDGIHECNAPIKSKNITTWNNRLWIAGIDDSLDACLYSTAFGLYNDWTSSPLVDSFYIKNALASSAKFTAIIGYQNALVCFRDDKSFVILGDDPSNYYTAELEQIRTITNNSVTNSKEGLVYLDPRNKGIFIYGTISVENSGSSKSLSDIVDGFFQFIDDQRLDEVQIVPFNTNNEIWVLVPEKSSISKNLFLICKFMPDGKYVWIKRRLPYNITSVTLLDDYITTTDDEGNVYRESSTTNEVAIARLYTSNQNVIDTAINNFLNFYDTHDGPDKPNMVYNGIPYHVYEDQWNWQVNPLSCVSEGLALFSLAFLELGEVDRAKKIIDFIDNTLRHDGNRGFNWVAALSGGSLMSSILYQYSQGLVLQVDSTYQNVIEIAPSIVRPAIFSSQYNVFIEDAIKSLDITTIGNNQFIDIYITEDTLDTPAIANTKPIKLVGKASGSTPYSTTPNSGQFLIGCVYIKNSIIIGVDSLETPNATVDYRAYWGVAEPFNFLIDSTTAAYSSNEIYVPVFKNSHAHFVIETQCTPDGAGSAWNFDIYVKNQDALSHYVRVRQTCSSNAGRLVVPLMDSDVVVPKLYTYQVGGKLNTDDASICNMYITWLYSRFTVQKSGLNSFTARS